MSEVLTTLRVLPEGSEKSRGSRNHRATGATRISVSTFGALAALAGIEHGLGEMLQGSVRPDSLAIKSWADSEAFRILGGEPAMTIIPDLLVTGILAIIVAIALGVWSLRFAERRHHGLVLVLLSILLLLVGGGFGPPLVGIIIGIAATRAGAHGERHVGRLSRALGGAWPLLLAAGVLGYLSLMPGMIILDRLIEPDIAGLVAGCSVFAFASLILTLVAARARDRLPSDERRHGLRMPRAEKVSEGPR